MTTFQAFLLVCCLRTLSVESFSPSFVRRYRKTALSVASSLPLPPQNGAVVAVDDEGTTARTPKVGVLLLNLGGPETGDDVEGFLYNLFADPDIIRLPSFLSPLQGVIAWIISKRRAPKSRAAYASIGGGSPILQYSRQQARLMCASVERRYGMPIQAYIGMRYWNPFTEEALDQIQRDKIEALVIVPLYPQFSISTSGSSLRLLQEAFSTQAMQRQPFVHTVVPSWYQRPGYIRAMVGLLQHELDAFTEDQKAQARANRPDQPPLHVLFSAHGVPQSYIAAGDPYQQQMVACVGAIEQEILKNNHDVQIHLSYQSRVGPIEWLRPYTDDVLPELGQTLGVTNLVVVPVSFVSEHIETLEEIDIEYRELAEASGITNWRRCPALNTAPEFIDDLADMVVEALAEPIQTVTEACIANNVDNLAAVGDDISAAGIQGVGGSEALRYRSGQQELERQERLVARIAILGVVATVLVELVNGDSLVRLLGGGM